MQRFLSSTSKKAVNSLFCNSVNYAKNNVVFYRCLSNAVENQQTRTTPIKNFNVSHLVSHINSGKVFYLKQLKNVFHTIDFQNLETNDATLLFKVCGSAVKDSPRDQRNEICQDLFKQLQVCNNLNPNILNCYIKTCTENDVGVFHLDLLKYDLEPDTYKLLLENVCAQGNIENAYVVLEVMKNKNITLDSGCISSIILGHTINGGLKAAEAVMDTMRSAQISKNDKAKLSIYKGLIRRNDFEDIKKALNLYPFRFTEEDLLIIIEETGLKGAENLLNELYDCYKHITITKEIQSEIEKICVHLVHMKQYQTAVNIYLKFVNPEPGVPYGFVILKQMLHCNVDINLIISVAKTLIEQDLNPYILESLTELTLKCKYQEQSWALLSELKVLRPHYFWPLLIQNAHSNGEIGVFETLKRIREFNVQLDFESLEHYVIPYCDLSNLKLLMMKLKGENFTVREFLSPLLIVLLRQNKPRRAAELCALHSNVNVTGTLFLPLLAKAWSFTKDTVSTVNLLARYCESNIGEHDWVGGFLIHVSKFYKRPDVQREYLNLIQMIRKQRLKITAQSADTIRELCQNHMDPSLLHDFNVNLNGLVDFQLSLIEDSSILHPRNMNLEELEAHLIELQEKNMETRGMLRRLIQLHASKGNFARVGELRELFINSGYEESAGVKSAIMYSYVQGRHLNQSLELYDELRTLHSNFVLDSFKIIDLAKLLIQNDRFDEAVGILEENITQSKLKNVHSIERNCKELLDACKNPEQVEKMFELLQKNGLCVPTNVILGSVLRAYFKSCDITVVVDKFVNISRKYNCTPLQLELLCAVAKIENSELLDRILKETEAVHGSSAAQVGLVSALAENGQENALRNTLTKLSVPVNRLLQKRCSRWVEERKIKPLLTLVRASARLPQKYLDLDFVNKCIVQIYDLNNDYNGAVAFLNELTEDLRSVTLEQEVAKISNKTKIAVNIQ